MIFCNTCGSRAVYRVVAEGPTKSAKFNACRRCVDSTRETAAMISGVRPTITEIGASSVTSGGPR